MRYLIAALLMLIGAAAVVFGEFDDSPGLQGIGLLLGIAGIVVVVRGLRRRARSRGTDRPA
ncbi:hypothetical protein [Brachybacterium sp. YJGR34]|uniref:hypothetical protein n=1 Tax=Brachybacterium sp. YJGR34 TaxID=2059911 RepID=UPI000E0CA8D2|nr:hypothetical protein [Brachybacterium sp. YJGR34]